MNDVKITFDSEKKPPIDAKSQLTEEQIAIILEKGLYCDNDIYRYLGKEYLITP